MKNNDNQKEGFMKPHENTLCINCGYELQHHTAIERLCPLPGFKKNKNFNHYSRVNKFEPVLPIIPQKITHFQI